ncbi:chloride channel protein [Methylophilus sp. DW102]|uniref:chloride channel protein n=1 Tax=Methylophilus sp. DW102 TaxID=3095607 RepID=UPI00308F4261|nr:chloride channel protein [Methylophilus sp. DW102]
MLNDLKNILASIKMTDVHLWLGRLIIWSAAIITGLVIVLFARATEYAIAWFDQMQSALWWLPLIVMPVVGIFIVWATKRWFAGAAGSGIPQTMAALSYEEHQPIGHLVSIKIAVSKMCLVILGLAAGFSAGREGPSVQVGASIMHAFRRFLPQTFQIDPKHLILAGGAAGISAAFNTPLAGIIFAIEELSRKFEQRTNGVMISAIVLSGLVSISLQGNYTYFGSLRVSPIDTQILLPVLIGGLVCGVFGGIFSKTLIELTENLPGRITRLRTRHPLYWTGFCALLVAGLGIVSHGAANGSGYSLTKAMLNGSINETWYYPVVKYLSTIFTYLSGIPGGIFAPALSIGAGIGYDLASIFHYHHLTIAFSALCMAGFLAGVTQAPITSFIIVMEMIDGHEMVISLMAVSLIATVTSRIFSRPLYSVLAGQFTAGPPDQKRLDHP